MTNIVVYSTSTCPYCIKAKEYFKKNGKEYTDINVGEDREKAEEMVKKSGQTGVPVIEIDGKIIIGFNKAKIDEILNITE